jgi:hypothetical protein
MGFLGNLIRTVFQWAVYFALIGGLGEATATLYKEAGNARAQGLVSLSRLNRSLQRPMGSSRSRALPAASLERVQ